MNQSPSKRNDKLTRVKESSFPRESMMAKLNPVSPLQTPIQLKINPRDPDNSTHPPSSAPDASPSSPSTAGTSPRTSTDRSRGAVPQKLFIFPLVSLPFHFLKFHFLPIISLLFTWFSSLF